MVRLCVISRTPTKASYVGKYVCEGLLFKLRNKSFIPNFKALDKRK